MAIPAFANRVMGHVGQYWLGVGLLLADVRRLIR